MLLRDLVQEGSDALARAHRESPRLCAELLIAHALHKERIDILTNPDQSVDEEQRQRCLALLERKRRGEPVSYILGEKEFYGLPFSVTKDTLIPRPETEGLIDWVREHIPKERAFTFADIGTGCGNIGLTLATYFPNARGILLDCQCAALAVAKKNSERLGIRTCVLVAGDLNHLPLAPKSLDLLVANPPYIALPEEHLVMDEVLAFEPSTALFAKKNGLFCLERLIDQAPTLLREGGCLCLEHGAEQGESVRTLLAKHFFSVGTKKDLAGRERISYGTPCLGNKNNAT
ncbi:MAG: peptide chain release factor N(5)-glutamine methyltransferase [Desulfovibrio sp.]|nr:peptide chain release factor N(5)-glutamine methyltransferase [Desulfovibrio sp.]